jgi:hypothetical protein
MCSRDNLRNEIQARLFELQASNIELIKLVGLDLINSDAWGAAIEDYSERFRKFHLLLEAPPSDYADSNRGAT